MSNMSNVGVFFLSGFSVTVHHKAVLFCLTLLCYLLIIMVNMCLIVTITLDKSLHEPMYILLCNLCINALYGTAGFYPKFAFDLLSDTPIISYVGCFVQYFIIYSYAIIDFSVLVVMAYDRYVAICRPLQYGALMSVQRTSILVALCWCVPLCVELCVVTLTSSLTLCGAHIDKLYCENWAVVKLACGSTTLNNIVGLIAISFYLGHILFIVCSYVPLVKSALKCTETRRKFTQTCVPHLLCLLNVTAALLFDHMYSRYGSTFVSQNVKNLMAVQFIVFPPVLNPIIYGLILKKIRHRVLTWLRTTHQRFKLTLKV
ncbi:olfactory receptor 63-like [Thalassophryne amazonica]|uniref:olfactory receptor 63-like n=1 Tax=Thalassophryne amazonica TaxID=390379 RepID=UPI0014720E70|nr:olfactory receptor 63-like [Thalassophryne amazonica]